MRILNLQLYIKAVHELGTEPLHRFGLHPYRAVAPMNYAYQLCDSELLILYHEQNFHHLGEQIHHRPRHHRSYHQ